MKTITSALLALSILGSLASKVAADELSTNYMSPNNPSYLGQSDRERQ